MKAAWRVSWMCPNPTCSQVHRIVAPVEEIIDLAAGLVATDRVHSILIQEETVALMAELDMAEEGRTNPQKVQDITNAYDRLKTIRHTGNIAGHGLNLPEKKPRK